MFSYDVSSQFFVGWVEERNPTHLLGFVPQPNLRISRPLETGFLGVQLTPTYLMSCYKLCYNQTKCILFDLLNLSSQLKLTKTG